ncbi:MAG: rhomboid family intramembrane serine protease [Planctomycetota bacterium]
MIPIRDDIPTKHPPVVTIVLIALNVLAFLWQLSGDSFQGRLFELAAVPANIVGSEKAPIVYVEVPSQLAVRMNKPYSPFVSEADAREIPASLGVTVYEQPIPAWMTILTSMFLHGGFGHLLFNMLFLWIFGNNIEDACGRLRFVLFYLATGVVATLAHVFSEAGSPIPTIGASGAISGVLGGYLLLYPHARVLTVIPFFFLYLAHLPAKVFLLLWFANQFLGLFGGGGVAWWAHIGGFVAGLALIKLFES